MCERLQRGGDIQKDSIVKHPQDQNNSGTNHQQTDAGLYMCQTEPSQTPTMECTTIL